MVQRQKLFTTQAHDRCLVHCPCPVSCLPGSPSTYTKTESQDQLLGHTACSAGSNGQLTQCYATAHLAAFAAVTMLLGSCWANHTTRLTADAGLESLLSDDKCVGHVTCHRRNTAQPR